MNLLAEITREARSILLGEAKGVLTDADDWQYRPLVADAQSPNDLREDSVSRMRRIARTFYFQNAVGGSMADGIVNRVMGAGIDFKAKHEDVDAVVKHFVADPDNDLEIVAPRIATELILFGKIVCPVTVHPDNGDVKVGYLNPDQIERILWRTGDQKQALAVIQRRTAASDKRHLWVVPRREDAFEGRYPPHPALKAAKGLDLPGRTAKDPDGNPVLLPDDPEIAKAMERDDLTVAGYAFYARTHCLVGGDGHSLFERSKDWIRVFDDFFFGQLRNAKLHLAFVWDVLLKGATPEQIRARQEEDRKLGPPPPGSILYHNEDETWEPKTPALANPAAIKELVTSTLKLIGISGGFPSHEMGAEDDVNRSTAKESGGAAIQKAKRFQREIAAIFRGWIDYAVDQKVAAGQLDALPPEDLEVEVVLPELNPTDDAAVATTVKTLVEGLSAAIDKNLVIERDARTAVYTALGMEIPSEAEFEKAKVDAEKKAADAFAKQQALMKAQAVPPMKGEGGAAEPGPNGKGVPSPPPPRVPANAKEAEEGGIKIEVSPTWHLEPPSWLADLREFDPRQPRDDKGQWTRSGFHAATDAERSGAKIPPAWTHVQFADDPDAPLVATGVDAKGRIQYRYSAAHTEAMAAAKFERAKAFAAIVPDLRRKISEEVHSNGSPEARVLDLIAKTGFRIGGEGDTKAEKEAFGATTLKTDHVTVSYNEVRFRFTGKKGVEQDHTITDPTLARYVEGRKRDGHERLFDTTPDKVREAMHRLAGTDFKVKDFRTHMGTAIAFQLVSAMPAPGTKAEYDRARRQVGASVAKHLGNTATVALESYIDPHVFAKWEAPHAE